MSVRVRELAPAARLRPLVEAIYFAHATRPSVHAVLPDGCVDLIYRYERGGGHGAAAGGALMVAGPDARARAAALGPDVGYVGARFRPGAARRVLGLDPADLVDRGLVPAAADARLALVERRLAGCPRSPAALARRLCVEVEALAGATAHLEPPARVRAAIALLHPGGETPPRVAAVAGALGVTSRTLQRELVAWTGLPPQLLARIFRLRLALRTLARGDGALAGVAAAAGYADQAHMAREFGTLAGAPPSAFR